MSSSSLRLVVAPPDGTLAPALDLPVPEGVPLHVHLHFGSPAGVPTAVTPALPRRRWLYRLLYAGVTVALVAFSYDVGTFAHRPAAYPPVAPAGLPPLPGGLPPAFRAQLAQPPVVTPAPAAPAVGSAFGLHP